jgi:hypothetical protein
MALASLGKAQEGDSVELTSSGQTSTDAVTEVAHASNPNGSSDSIMIEGVDSDYYFLEMRPSSLPGVQGNGVFAKADIPSGEIICEYRGPIIKGDAYFLSDKLYNINSIKNETMKIVGDTICAYINDCIDIAKIKYTRYENGSVVIHESAIVPTFENHPYNAVPVTTNLGKVFIASSTLIPGGTEVCFFYGW